LQEAINANNAKAKELSAQVSTLKNTVAGLSIQINQATAQIQLIDVKLQQLQTDLENAQTELERQKGLLKSSMRALYKRGGASTVELLVGSDSFSDFINDQEYLERLKTGIQESTEKIIQLKLQIQAQQDEQKSLKAQQEAQRTVLEQNKTEQANLLSVTRGEEARYKDLVSKLKKEKAEADAALARAIGSGSYRTSPVGPVSAGDIVGGIGSSGLSSGPHLHLEVRQGGSTRNPADYIQHQPVLMPPAWISQGYWNSDPIYYSGHHPGVDYAGPAGMAISAIDSGYMYRGCSNQVLGTSNNAYGYVAIVEHNNGAISIYAHMSGGPSGCSYNTYY
ncbi:MAG: hypothetical protein Q7T74_03300, partial [Candidatus Saccharibacteria bacterium]|nr:hypothetical protein [Candidatus Saccharibacteria bacterium]